MPSRISFTGQVHMNRWERVLGASLMKRLVFLPRVPQSEMLVIMSYCRVMLDTFPWGAGVTSLEALSRGLPVVTLPSSLSVLHLAAGQASIPLTRNAPGDPCTVAS